MLDRLLYQYIATEARVCVFAATVALRCDPNDDGLQHCVLVT